MSLSSTFRSASWFFQFCLSGHFVRGNELTTMVGIIWNGTLRHNSIFGAARAAGRGLYSIRMRMNNRKFVKS